MLLEELPQRIAALAGGGEVHDAAAAGGLGEGLGDLGGVERGLGAVAVAAAFADDADQLFREADGRAVPALDADLRAVPAGLPVRKHPAVVPDDAVHHAVRPEHLDALVEPAGIRAGGGNVARA